MTVPDAHACSTRQANRGPDDVWKGADALVVDRGADNEDELYSKSAALQTWLLGYEFPETVMVVCAKAVVVLTSKKKGAHRTRWKDATPAAPML